MEIIPFLQTWGVVIVSVLSLIIAFISLCQSGRAQKLQNKVNELELQLKQYEVDKLNKEKADAQTACVEARFISMGQGKYRIKVWNSGKAPAYNVIAKFADDPEIMLFNDDKMPYEVLEANKSFELQLIVHLGSSHKARIITEWYDESGKRQSKEQVCSW